jgi:AAHS family 4-hydroxybenzoate transporter-like MFS transporter
MGEFMSTAVGISDLLDENPVSRNQVLIIILCALVAFMDGFDAQAIGYVAPSLLKAWHLKPAALGPVFSSGLFGLMLGALFIAPLADRFGRRPLILISTAAFGLMSLATVTAHDVQSLTWLRFLTGLGLGGCMPNAISATSEFAPARTRAFLVMVMFGGFTTGSLVGGLTASQLVSAYGWQSVFAVGGILPLALIPVLLIYLPESPRYLLLSGAPQARLMALARRLVPKADIAPDVIFRAEQTGVTRMSVASLFQSGRARSTALLWTIFFCSLLDVYLLVNWLPTLMNSVGASIKTSILAGSLLQLGGLIGGFLLGVVFDRRGARMAMAPAYLLASACIAAIGFTASVSIPLTLVAVLGAGFGVIGGQTAANALSAITYPTEIRSTGVGWALGIGRIGSIAGPALAGVLIGMQMPMRTLFLLSALPALVAAVATLGVVIARPDAASRA